MNPRTIEKWNGVGSMVRFITPVLVTVAIFILGTVITNQGKLDDKMICMQKEQTLYFSNHLSDYSAFRIMIEHRLTKIEARLPGALK